MLHCRYLKQVGVLICLLLFAKCELRHVSNPNMAHHLKLFNNSRTQQTMVATFNHLMHSLNLVNMGCITVMFCLMLLSCSLAFHVFHNCTMHTLLMFVTCEVGPVISFGMVQVKCADLKSLRWLDS